MAKDTHQLTNSDSAGAEGPYEAAMRAGAYLRSLAPPPDVAIVLGSGLGAFADELTDPLRIPYDDIPQFSGVGVEGHAGVMVVGTTHADDGKQCRVAALCGRVHLYEGHPLATVVHAVRTLHAWGVEVLVLTNAAGGLRTDWESGDLMLMSDHINLTGHNPLCGANDARLGPRFPDMSAAYDPKLREMFRACASETGLTLREGVYAGVLGPSYETPAEVRMLGRLGADAVGMSTVNEVIAAAHIGLRVAGISCISNPAAGLSMGPITHAEVQEVTARKRPHFLKLLRNGLPRLRSESKP